MVPDEQYMSSLSTKTTRSKLEDQRTEIPIFVVKEIHNVQEVEERNEENRVRNNAVCSGEKAVEQIKRKSLAKQSRTYTGHR